MIGLMASVQGGVKALPSVGYLLCMPSNEAICLDCPGGSISAIAQWLVSKACVCISRPLDAPYSALRGYDTLK